MQKQDVQEIIVKEFEKLFFHSIEQIQRNTRGNNFQKQQNIISKNFDKKNSISSNEIKKIKLLNIETKKLNSLLVNDFNKNIQKAYGSLSLFATKGQSHMNLLSKSIKKALSLLVGNFFNSDSNPFRYDMKPHTPNLLGMGLSSLNITPFAKGGIIDSPTLTPAALIGEAGPEAITPLSRTAEGKLGVNSKISAPVFNMTISTYTKDPIEVSARQDENRNMHVLLEEIDKGIASKINTEKSHIGNVLKDIYHLNRKGQ